MMALDNAEEEDSTVVEDDIAVVVDSFVLDELQLEVVPIQLEVESETVKGLEGFPSWVWCIF